MKIVPGCAILFSEAIVRRPRDEAGAITKDRRKMMTYFMLPVLLTADFWMEE